jgi:hypothetical protein
MVRDEQVVMQEVIALVAEYRERCLWFLREDYLPRTTADALRVLQLIERHGDVASLRKVAPLKQWLLQRSNDLSAA